MGLLNQIWLCQFRCVVVIGALLLFPQSLHATSQNRLKGQASTTIADTAPILLSTGVLMATPEGGAIEFDGTNLYYTSEGNSRKIVGSSSAILTVSKAVATDSSGNLVTSGTSSTELGYLAGVTNTNGGIVYGNGGKLATTAAGTLGQVLTSNVEGIPSWTTATNAGSASTIVKRDATGNFTAGTITATLTGTSSLDLPLSGGTMTGTITGRASTTIASTSAIKLPTGVLMATPEGGAIEYDGTSLFYTDAGNTRRTLSFSSTTLSTSKAMATDGSGVASVSATTSLELGYLSGVTNTNGGIVYGNGGKLATTAAGTAGQVLTSNVEGIPSWVAATNAGSASSIVKRDATGNFTAGTITATLTGSASLNLLLTGGTMTGTITGLASTTIASTSPIKLAKGVLMATAEGGAIEYNGTSLFYTTEGNTRRTLAITASAALTASKALASDSSGLIATSGTTDTELGYLSGVLNTNGGIVYGNGGKLATTAAGTVAGQVLTSNVEGIPSWVAATNAGSASSIVKRDATGNFTAGTITATLTGTSTLDLPLSGGTMTGTITSRASTTIASTSPIKLAKGVLMATAEGGAIEYNGTSLFYTTEGNTRRTLAISAAAALTASKALASDSSGLVTTSGTSDTELGYLSGVLNTNGGIVYGNGGKLATTAAGTVAGQVLTSNVEGIPSWVAATNAGSASSIVKRDATGNFTAGTITATLTGSASLNLLLTGGTMTGTITGRASTTIASTSAIKLPVGVLMATPEVGAIEYDGTTLFYTNSSNSRKPLAISLKTCAIIIGAENGSTLGTADIGPQKRQCFITAASTIVEVNVSADAGTATVQVGKNSAGTVTNLLSAALATAASGGIACSKTTSVTGIDGATSCTNTLTTTAVAVGDYLETVSSTTASTAKRMSIFIVYTTP